MTAALFFGSLLIAFGALGYGLYKLSQIKGASDVLTADNAANTKGTKSATQEITKHVETTETEDSLGKGSF